MSFTDADLEQSRTKYTRIANGNRDLHALLHTLRRREGLDNVSKTLDRALRVELAHAIDNYDVTFEHEDWGVRYLIPPVTWLHEQDYGTQSPVDLQDPPENDEYDRTIGFTTTPIVFEMAQAAIDEGAYDSLSNIVEAGIRRMLGRLD